MHTNADIGLVSDSGAAFGTPGGTEGDDRFGDIRIGAVPLSPDVLAISVPADRLYSGTWAADVILNSNGEFTSIDDLFAVVLHEAGHVFGLCTTKRIQNL